MTGVSSFGDADGFGPPVPDWLEHAFATGEWPVEADNSFSTVFVPPGRYDEVPPLVDVEPDAWAVPGVPVDTGVDVEHPVVAAIGAASEALCFDGLDWMSTADAGAGLVAVQRLVARASALAAVLLARAEELEVHRENGASTAAVG